MQLIDRLASLWRKTGSFAAKADGWLRLVAWLALANVMHVFAVIGAPLAFNADQSLDALLTLSEYESTLWRTGLLLPSAIAAILIGVSSILVGAEVSKRFALRRAGLVSRYAADIVCVVLLPFLLATGAAVNALTVAGLMDGIDLLKRFQLFFVIESVAIAIGVGSLCCVHRSLRPSRRKQEMGISASVRAALAAILVSALIIVLTASTDPTDALKFGPVGMVVVAAAFWSALLTLVLITMPLVINWLPASAAFIGLVLVFSFRMADPYRMPQPLVTVNEVLDLDLRRHREGREAFFAWLESRVSTNDDGGPIPVVLVSANGGGIRTAYWAARSLALLDRKSNGLLSKHTFVYSGVSGGSIGLATFLDSAARHRNDPEAVIDEIDRYYARDLLSPVVSRLLFMEPLRLITGSTSIRGRDQVFEEHLDSQWFDVTKSNFFSRTMLDAFGLHADQQNSPPLVVFNSTIAETGVRLEIANVGQIARRSRNQTFLTYHREVNSPLLTVAQAVHLSARFPGISPPASLQAEMCDNPTHDRQDGPCRWVPRHWFTAVDGGYSDNSGLAPIISLVNELTNDRDDSKHAHLGPPGMAESAIERRRTLLSRVSFHVVVLAGNPDYRKKRQKLPNGEYVTTVKFSPDPFQQAWDAEEPMGDLGAAWAALDNARQGREPDNWMALEILMGKVNLMRPKDSPRLLDEVILHSISYALNPRDPRAADKLATACDKIPDDQLAGHLADIPLGWSLSTKAQLSMQCAAERVAEKSYKRLRNLPRYWDGTQRPD